DNNIPYKQDYTTTSQEHMVFICLHPAAKIPHITETTQQSTGTDYGVELYAYSDNNTNKPKPKITNTGTYYDGVSLSASSSKNTTYNQDYTTIHRNIRQWCFSVCRQR
ncbi:hypothetical protein, partial [Methanobrevibacter arboriphilus]|uniref:hypothetical protein n=2 Tax=Methanobrevibacter arboriphilus TaxID=39441 RepID=UPI00249216BC